MMFDELDKHDANTNERHRVRCNDEIGFGVYPVGDPQHRADESLHLRRDGDPFNSVSLQDSEGLGNREDQRQRNAQHAE